jgi:O-6-methylguanine DNA methyltransferase
MRQEIHSAVIRHKLTNVIVKGIPRQRTFLLTELIVGSRARGSSSAAPYWQDNSLLSQAIRQLTDYLNGLVVDFSKIPIDLEGKSKFQKAVLQAARRIPYGKTASYSMLAKMAGYPRAVRAVGSVMRKNPLPIVIPCHRVIRKDGSPGAYAGDWDGQDAALKRTLLRLEKETLHRHKA